MEVPAGLVIVWETMLHPHPESMPLHDKDCFNWLGSDPASKVNYLFQSRYKESERKLIFFYSNALR